MKTTRSDPRLLSEIRRYGRFDTNACLQCGTCTLSCSLTSSLVSFPRRTLRFALLGLREPLNAGLAPWLCYYCGDCSTACQREADPGEGMMTLRRYLATQYDWTGLSAKIHRSWVWEIGALLVAGLLTLLLILCLHLFGAGIGLADLSAAAGLVGMEHMHGSITLWTQGVFILAALLLLTNAARMHRLTMRRCAAADIPLHFYVREAGTFFLHALIQRRLRDCGDRSRWFLHLMLVSGCLLMFVLVFFGLEWFQTDSTYSLTHPQRWLGYVATLAIVVPLAEILIARIRKRNQMHQFSEGSDWILPTMLMLTALSGIALHILRYLGLATAAHTMYVVHMVVTVPLLLIEVPFGKWSHVLYRPLAVYFQAVSERAMAEQSQPEALVNHAS